MELASFYVRVPDFGHVYFAVPILSVELVKNYGYQLKPFSGSL
ncbi:hypothetical protein [Paenibacillus sp. 7541]|nr:hypothetical protein [Paenibacillus sp. 7541]